MRALLILIFMVAAQMVAASDMSTSVSGQRGQKQSFTCIQDRGLTILAPKLAEKIRELTQESCSVYVLATVRFGANDIAFKIPLTTPQKLDPAQQSYVDIHELAYQEAQFSLQKKPPAGRANAECPPPLLKPCMPGERCLVDFLPEETEQQAVVKRQQLIKLERERQVWLQCQQAQSTGAGSRDATPAE